MTSSTVVDLLPGAGAAGAGPRTEDRSPATPAPRWTSHDGARSTLHLPRPVGAAGVDLVDLDRFEGVAQRCGAALERRLCTAAERDLLPGARSQRTRALAAVFGMKEGVVKALGGFGRGGRFVDICTAGTAGGGPVVLSGATAARAREAGVVLVAGVVPPLPGTAPAAAPGLLCWAAAVPADPVAPQGRAARPGGTGRRVPTRSSTVHVFPGQGSQHPGMGRDLDARPGAREVVGEAEEVTGLPVGELMARADAATLADPRVAQVVVLVHSCVMLEQLGRAGARPSAVAGHSLGEFTALVAAGCLERHEALALVAVRGEVMADAARERPGAMAAVVGLPLLLVHELCATAGDAVVANVNSARQQVVSGTVEAVAAVVGLARSAGALRVRELPVGGAYHSPLMAGAQERFAPHLARAPLRAPGTPVVSSIDGELVTDVEAYRRRLVGQMTAPVLWHRALGALAGRGATFVEVGPGRVLTGLGRESVRDALHRGAGEVLGAPARPVAAEGARSSR